MRWLVDYMGAVALLLGLAGLVWACVRGVRPAAADLRLTLPLGVIATAVYCLRPAAFPDQPWVIRRFTAEVIPILLIFATWLLARIWSADWRAAGVCRAAVVVGAALVVALPLLVLRPVVRASAGHHNQDLMHALCSQIGPNAAVLVGGGPPTTRWYPDSIRAFCGVPTASTDQTDRAALQRLAASWGAAGRQLVLVTPSPSAIARWGIPTGSSTTLEVIAPHGLEVAINRPPSAYRPLRMRVTFAPVRP
jgi:hypothetical protein